ncbi:coenzyme F420-0:L-glutamate ligase [Brachybacterium phenoliresistens]|uniref:coenzyme F420-0:L-glutamate ligase n=1 Tax=Brachybacterium phenoliresistens TaxID=396014 RepID=UPI0031D79330
METHPRTAPHPPAAPRPGRVEVLPLHGVPEVAPGDDLAALLLRALELPDGPGLEDGDVLCVSTKVVSKALGLVIDPAEKQEAIAAQTVRLVARRRHDRTVTSVVQTPHGAVMAAAGIDGSNAPDGLLLLPEDPDAEAGRLRDRLLELIARTGPAPRIGVVLTDTSSRIWRRGVGDIALGCAGVASLQDLRGSADAGGRTLSLTVRDLADELAAAADLVKGKASAVPAALVRGVPGALSPAVPAGDLNRLPPEDWFARPSLESVWQALGLPPESEPVARMDPEEPAIRIARALEVALVPRGGSSPAAAGEGTGAPAAASAELVGPQRIRIRPAGAAPAALLAAGALAERVRTALAAEHDWSPLPAVAVEIDLPGEDDGTAPDRSPAHDPQELR